MARSAAVVLYLSRSLYPTQAEAAASSGERAEQKGREYREGECRASLLLLHADRRRRALCFLSRR